MWTYSRTLSAELGIRDKGRPFLLRPHVHARVQIMVVSQGSRRVLLGSHMLTVPAGAALVIPPMVAHAAQNEDWDGFNIYVPPSHCPDMTARLVGLAQVPAAPQALDCAFVLLRDLLKTGQTIWADPDLSPFDPSSAAASDWPISREGMIRRYRREAGISPYAHFSAIRLDKARHLLAEGQPVAAVAAELGFADQSHLGRQFLATFGTTPGTYISGR